MTVVTSVARSSFTSPMNHSVMKAPGRLHWAATSAPSLQPLTEALGGLRTGGPHRVVEFDNEEAHNERVRLKVKGQG
jgi:hypothetical protein